MGKTTAVSFSALVCEQAPAVKSQAISTFKLDHAKNVRIVS